MEVEPVRKPSMPALDLSKLAAVWSSKIFPSPFGVVNENAFVDTNTLLKTKKLNEIDAFIDKNTLKHH